MVVLVLFLACFLAVAAADGEFSFSIEHSMDNGRYSLTHSFTHSLIHPLCRWFRSYQTRSKFSYDKSKKEIKHTKVVAESELRSLRELLTSDIAKPTNMAANHSLYLIRTLSNAQDSKSPYIYAAIPACDLQRSGYKEKIVLHFDYKDSIIGTPPHLLTHSLTHSLIYPCIQG